MLKWCRAEKALLVSALSQRQAHKRYTDKAIRPKKSYGQNFLKDSSVSANIVRAANVSPGDHVVEIGPGTGMLTAELLKMHTQVTAIENDHEMMNGLQSKFHKEIEAGQMMLVQGDATKLDLHHLLADKLPAHTRWKVVANLPFNITTDILKKLLPLSCVISEVFVMLQMEAAQRLCGNLPGNESYRAMSVWVEFYSQAEASLGIDRTAFYPQPNVDCQMVSFQLKAESARVAVPSEAAFLQLVKVCFGSRRKTLQNNLKAAYPLPSVIAAMNKLGLQRNVRPQDLHANDFAALTRLLAA